MDIVMSEFLLYIKAGFLGDKWNTFLNVRKERMHQMNNVSPLLKGKNVILRKPKDSDVNDYLACKQKNLFACTEAIPET